MKRIDTKYLKRAFTSCFCILLLLISASSFAKEKEDLDSSGVKKVKNVGLKVIVIDAGHGGRDGGAQGQFTNEKTISLAVALKLRDLLKKKIPSAKIIMTRSTDVTQDVRKKAKIANAAKGDLFISIHCNSVPTAKSKKGKYVGSKITGTETYIWGVDKTNNKQLAMRENESFFMDKQSKEEMQAFKKNAPEKNIYYALKTRQYFQRSAHLAQEIENQFSTIGRSSHNAKQRTKGIWVLQATAMPSVLVETGFISTPSDEKYMKSESGQHQIALCVAQAVVNYKKHLELKSAPIKSKKVTTSKLTSSTKQAIKSTKPKKQKQ